MNYCIIILVISLQINSLCIAQEVITISEENFNQNGGISLTSLDGWLFIQQEVPDWNEPDLNTHNWKKLNPNNLSFRYADKNGLVEGWFRLSFKVDSSLWGQNLYLNIMPSGAAEMYINGELYDASGKPNKDPRIDEASVSYFSRISSGWLPKPITIDSGTYVIAIYCTDHSRYLLDKYTFRSMNAGFEIGLFKKKFLLRHIKMLSEYDFYQGIWLSGILLLSFLFGILLLLNQNEKNLQWIAALTFFLACSALIEFLFSTNARGIWRLDIGDLLYYESIALAVGLIPITLSQIILNNVNKKMYMLWILLAVMFPVLWFFYGTLVMDIVIYSFMGAALLTIAAISVRLIVSNRKNLGKAEWSVIWGLIILVLWMLIHTIFINIGFGSNAYRLMTVTMIYLTLPIALLIYISIRFSDNIFTLRKNIVEISRLNNEKLRVQEEKQKLILTQKEVLEKEVSERTAELVIKNRELEIETSLERVRAVAMSMQKSDDLISICEASFKEFQKLGFDSIRNAIIHIPNDGQKYFNDYDYSELTGGAITKIKYGSHPIVDEYLKKIRSAKDAYFEVVINEDQLAEWKDFRKKSGQQDDPQLDDATALYYYLFSIGIGDIGISTFKPIDDSQIKILKRFRNVFDLAYRRYNDIELAEAQAREAQIELALERVRARTMAMQKSEELKEVIRVVYDQFVQLKINVDHAGFVVNYTPKGDWHFWIADEQDIPSKITHPYFESIWASQFNEAKEKGADYFVTNLNFNEKNKFYNELLSYVPGLPKESKDFYLSCPGLAASTALFESVSLYIENFSGIPYTDEENRILMRFGKVFQQTYTRFLDLQRVEAQNKIIQGENERKTKELEAARQLQLSMLPKKLPQLHHLDIAVYMKTATEVGGDYYDFNVDINGTLTVLVGDATGHGMMSGMMVSIMKSFFISNKFNIDLKTFFENANNSIKDMQLGRLMMACMGVQITSEKIIATNAGMPSLIYFRNKSQKAGEFVSHNYPLGGMKGTKYSLKEIKYEKGDTLLLMSDGFAELKNENNEQSGYPRIIKEFKSVVYKSSNEIVEYLKNLASEWAKGTESDDDITFVVIKVK